MKWLIRQWELFDNAHRNWKHQNYGLHMLCKPHSYILLYGKDVFMVLFGIVIGSFVVLVLVT